MFTKLGQHVNAKLEADFRPVANVRVLYRTFANMIFGCIEHCLRYSWPEKQNAFRSGEKLGNM